MRPIFALILACLLNAPALAAEPKPPKAAAWVLPADREAAGGRAVQIELAQKDIDYAVDIGRVAVNPYTTSYDNYWFWNYEDPTPFYIEELAQREAEYRIAPLRKALAGFDGDALAQSAIRSGLAKSSWFRADPIEVNRHPSKSSRQDFAAVAQTSQLAAIRCHYYMSPEFNQVEVVVDLVLARKVPKKKRPQVFYFHRLTSIVQLAKPSLDPVVNVRSWSADQAKSGRAALTAAFARMEQLIPRALDMTQQDLMPFMAKKQAGTFAAGRMGPLVERTPDGITIWANGLVSVHQLPVVP